ncbi:esterase E4-like isoform X1 [Melanaphis sacchari]|uniref:esterase E4-like isoform X1 n=2 Tax=Melanaphis sacchari TaxID=742174 RepID=UPI000DC1449F|nr:esterase E4-like isoform X1 [Melanaphis sacchari]
MLYMIMKWILFAVMMYSGLVYCLSQKLKITKGVIKGQILKSRNGQTYYSYTGIPYANPPIGELRFKAPVPVEPWDGVLDATKESNICIQQGNTDSQEDCLYLNVYSPKTNKKSLPIMFWIHGGGFISGHGRSSLYGPDYIMDKDVILVTIHYRLGIFGFLSTEDDVIPGNYGVKDQVAALRWVQENIVYFNGDPNQVTIFGGSAGGASTGFHMLSPMSKSLFHKVILQSGTPLCKWAILPPGISRKRAHAVATISGCNFNTSEDILQCLRKVPAQNLLSLHAKLITWLNHPTVLFNPVVENCNSDQEAFLCHHPILDFHQESFVPAIVGLNSEEGSLFVASLYNNTSLIYPEFQTDFNRLISIITFYNYYVKTEYIDEIGEKVFGKYFPSGSIDDHTHSNAVNMFTDSCFTEGILDMAYKLSSPVYSYFYNYQNEFSYNKLFGSCEKPLGVTHGDELNSIFKMNSLNPNDLNEKDLEVSKLIINVWYKFVISDNPTIDGSENGLPWPKFTRSNQTMILFNSSYPSLIQNPRIDAYEFWKKLYEPVFLDQFSPEESICVAKYIK